MENNIKDCIREIIERKLYDTADCVKAADYSPKYNIRIDYDDYNRCLDDIVDELVSKYIIIPRNEKDIISMEETMWVGVTPKGEVTEVYSNRWL